MNHYEVLGVSKDADKNTIKKAYRKAARKAHPDRNGGDTKAMVAVNVAYDVLSDPARRQRYDIGGDDGPAAPPLDLHARVVLAEAFSQTAMQDKKINHVAQAHAYLKKAAQVEQVKISDMDRIIARLKKKLPEVTFEPSEGNVLNMWDEQVMAMIRNMTDVQEKARERVRAIDRAREMLVAYRCTIIESPRNIPAGGLLFTAY